MEETPPYQNSPVHSDDVLIFLKYYDPLEKLLQYVRTVHTTLNSPSQLNRYVGHAVVRSSTKVFSLVPLVNGMVGNLLGTPLLVFEEVKPDMVDPLQPNLTLNALEIATGDILVFQVLILLVLDRFITFFLEGADCKRTNQSRFHLNPGSL